MKTNNTISITQLFKEILSQQHDFELKYKAKQFLVCLLNSSLSAAPLIRTDAELKTSSPREFSQILINKLSVIHEEVPEIPLNHEIIEFILLQYAPRGLLNGCVVQYASNAANNHEHLASILHQIHSLHVGGGNARQNENILFRQLLENKGINLPSISSVAFIDNSEIMPEALKLPAYFLGLSLFSKEKLPEILGACLFDALFPIPEIIRTIQLYLAKEGDPTAYFRTKLTVNFQQIKVCAENAIMKFLEFDDNANNRIRIINGMNVALSLNYLWTMKILNILNSSYFSHFQKMKRLIIRKSTHAMGYHSHVKLKKGLKFEETLAQSPEDFVSALGESHWVVAGHPEQSLLLTKLIDFKGPMFRVFSDKEIDIMKDWIISLAEKKQTEPNDYAEFFKAEEFMVDMTDIHSHVINSSALRDLYYYLLNIEDYPQILPQAKKFALEWLTQSAIDLNAGEKALPFEEYSHQNLRNWFELQAKIQVDSYPGDQEEITKTREEVIDEALQLCPMISIDGAWLQRWTTAGLIDTEIGANLYKIYSDEVGNGEVELNHPLIYRNLIEEMGISLPKFASYEFCHWAGFEEDSFKVPVFWLSISQFPQRFMAETLGLNLAMELSGVGGAYRTAKDELRHYGYSTLFVELHNTIDNVSTGHSAMALQAIEFYMDEILQNHDKKVLSEHWERIWTGYRALVPPKKMWKTLFIKNKRYVET